ncbi:MAG: hypothetical protein ABI833_21690 [Acidobacteriota bacterium]
MEGHLPSSSGHETRDASVRPIVLTGVALAVTIVIVGLIVYGTFQYLAKHRATSALSNPMSVGDSQIPPEPRIEEHPAIAIQQLHAQEDQVLSTYSWTDKKTGVVRIPIDRAMELQLMRGFPTRKEQRHK